MRVGKDIWKECIPCKGLCCKWETVLLTQGEIDRIAKKVGKKDFYKKKKKYWVLKQDKDGLCIFYNRKRHRCNIHKVRPFDCEVFPFDIEYYKGRLIWFLWTFCPVVKKQKLSKKKFDLFLNNIELFESKILKEFTEKELIKYSTFYDPNLEEGKTWKIIRDVKLLK
ncbi:MAG: YkgJ family cysteine cluster protein [archaeon]|nr:MAG: YkgJ family cysteine cluster protein [archaeon]